MAFFDTQSSKQHLAKGEGADPAEGGGGPLLEYLHNVVTKPTMLGSRFDLVKCGCKCWYCPDCCALKGYNLRARLIPALESFKGLLMVTLTLDPELFDSHEEAYFYAREKRCISVLMQSLDRLGHLHSRRYIYVVEFQQSGNPHYHLLMDASRVPHDVIQREWSKNRPKNLPPPPPNRSGFGFIWISKARFEGGHAHAGRYATKYLIKVPDYGWPKWVLRQGAERRVPRYGVSHGFWNEPKREPSRRRRKFRVRCNSVSYADRLDQCGSTTNVMGVTSYLMPSGEIKEAHQWIARMGISTDVFPKLDEYYMEGSRRARISAEQGHTAIEAVRQAAGRDVQVISIAAQGVEPNAPK